MRSVRLIISSAVVVGAAIFAVVHLRTLEVRRLTAQVNELEEQRQELESVQK